MAVRLQTDPRGLPGTDGGGICGKGARAGGRHRLPRKLRVPLKSREQSLAQSLAVLRPFSGQLGADGAGLRCDWSTPLAPTATASSWQWLRPVPKRSVRESLNIFEQLLRPCDGCRVLCPIA